MTGGPAAVATRVGADRAVGEPGGAWTGAVLLEAVLARVTAPRDGTAEVQPRSEARREVDPALRASSRVELPDGRSLQAPATSATPEPSHPPRPLRQELDRTRAFAERAPVEVEAPSAARGGQALAELVRRWQHGAAPEGIGQSTAEPETSERELPAGPDAEHALARAVEHLLAGELRRSGIELEAG